MAPYSDPEDILQLWQLQYGVLDEEDRDEFLFSPITEELSNFSLDVIQNAILRGNVSLKHILTFAYRHSGTYEGPVLLSSFTSEIDVGAYALDGKIFSIRKDKQSGNLQAWEYDSVKREYRRPFFSSDERLILGKLDSSKRLTLRMAERYSLETGICCHCGRYLSARKSVSRGMGPVCRKLYH